MDTLESMQMNLRPTASRPLLGLTILAVEDSRYACDAMRLMCLRSGARIRRADCLSSARRHLQVYRPSVAIVDMGLPDGSGAELITELKEGSSRVDSVLGVSGDCFAEDLALAAGADGFLAKPVPSVAAFQAAVLATIPEARRPRGPRVVHEDMVCPDPLAFQDDMAHAADVLDSKPNEKVMDYAARFLTGVARIAGDNALEDAAQDLAVACSEGKPQPAALARVAALVQDRLAQQVAI